MTQKICLRGHYFAKNLYQEKLNNCLNFQDLQARSNSNYHSPVMDNSSTQILGQIPPGVSSASDST